MNGFDFEEINKHNSQIHLCNYEDFDPSLYTDYLNASEKERMHSFNSISRKREFIATRILRQSIFGEEHIHYDQNGAPYIKGKGFISISHCNNLVGIALNNTYKVGLDLESPRKNILDLKNKFLSEQEFKMFDCNDSKEVTKIWSSKEALYKLAGRKKIIFKTELLLSKGNDGNWLGQIVNPDHDLYVKLDIFEHLGNYVSINKKPIVKVLRNS